MSTPTKNIVTVNSIDQANKQAWKISRSTPKEALKLAGEALLMAETLNYSKGKGEALSTIGASNLWLSNFDEAIENCMDASRIFEEIHTPIPLGRVKYTMGTVFFYISDYDNAITYYIEALENYHEGRSEIGKADAYNGMGSVYYAINENEKSLHYLKKSKKICIEHKAYKILQKVYDGLGQAYINLKEYSSALKVLDSCLDLLKKHGGSSHVKAHCLNKLGKVHLLQGNPTKAFDYFSQSLKLREKDGFKPGVADCWNQIGKSHLVLQEYEKAENFFNQALSLAKKIKAKDVEKKVLLNLSSLYESKNDPVKALEYFKDYHELRDSIKKDIADKKTKGLELRFKIEQEKNEKILLQKQNEKLKKYSEDLVILGEIGQSLTSLLSVEKIIETAQKKLNTLMDATSFGLGIYNPATNQLNFPGYIEAGRIFPNIAYDVKEDQRLANTCFLKKEEILIHDFENEHSKWIQNFSKPKAGKQTLSIIYIPFSIPNGSSGVITVQSFKSHQYTEHHVNMLRNLSLYMASALENALLYQSLEEKVETRTKEIIKQKENLQATYNNTRIIAEMGQEIISCHDMESIFQKMDANVNQLLDSTIFSIRLCDFERNIIEYTYTVEKGERHEAVEVSLDDIDNYSVWCVRNKQDIFISDHARDYKKYTKNIVVASGDDQVPESLIFTPLIAGEKVIGVLSAQSFEKNAYTEYQLDILKSLGGYLSVALENANILEHLEKTVDDRTQEIIKQKEEIEKTYQDAEMLNKIGREINATLSIEDIISQIYEQTNQIMDCTIFGIGFVNESKNCLELKGAYEKGEPLPDIEFTLDDESSLTSWCIRNSKEIVILDYFNDINNYVKYDDKKSVKAGERPESIIYIPLITKGKTIGTISVQSFEPNAYNDYHLNIVRNLALYAATAIENAGLYSDMEHKVQERAAEIITQKEEIETTYNNTRLLSKMGQEIISCHNLETIFEKMLSNVNQLIDATIFSIRICDYKTNEIEYSYTIENGTRKPKVRVSLDDIDNYSVWVVRNNQDIFINDHQNEYHKYTNKIVVVRGDLPEYLIFCPLVIKDKVIGVISAQSFQKNAYSYYHLDILRSLGAYLAIALENAHILENLEDTVEKRTLEVVQQKEIIEEKNKDITDSIRYAQQIQNVIMPSIGDFQNNFKSSFIYFKPRDIVSGDFYWLERIENKIYFTVVDCTGHGVPGALVSLMGANGLNRCINEFGLRKPSEILDKLREIVTNTFANTGNSMKDGMDMALCMVDFENNVLEYSGANNPLWILRDSKQVAPDYEITKSKSLQLIEVKPDKQPVGQFDNLTPFTNHVIQLQKNDRIYLFTDGFADQFGGADIYTRKKGGKKFKYSNLKKLIFDLKNVNMNEQYEHFSQTFETWKGDFEQVDDVCIVGVQI